MQYIIQGKCFKFSAVNLVEDLVNFLKGGSNIEAILREDGIFIPLIQGHIGLTYLEDNHLVEIKVNKVVTCGPDWEVKVHNANLYECIIHWNADRVLTNIRTKTAHQGLHPEAAILRRDWQVGDTIIHSEYGEGKVIDSWGRPFSKYATCVFKKEFPKEYDFANLPPVQRFCMKVHQDMVNPVADDTRVYLWNGVCSNGSGGSISLQKSKSNENR